MGANILTKYRGPLCLQTCRGQPGLQTTNIQGDHWAYKQTGRPQGLTNILGLLGLHVGQMASRRQGDHWAYTHTGRPLGLQTYRGNNEHTQGPLGLQTNGGNTLNTFIQITLVCYIKVFYYKISISSTFIQDFFS